LPSVVAGSGDHDLDAARPLVIDVDATLVTAHSEKEGAAPTFKRGFRHHPLWAFVDHRPSGTGEPLAALLRPGNAGSSTGPRIACKTSDRSPVSLHGVIELASGRLRVRALVCALRPARGQAARCLDKAGPV